MKNWLKIFCCLLLCSCGKKEESGRAFYHWKTHFNWSAADSLFSDSISLQRLYVRFFDVVAGKDGIHPVATIRWDSSPPKGIEIVPVVYITENALAAISAQGISELAQQICDKINRLKDRIDARINEMQIDCDWTQHSRKNYFTLLEKIKSRISPWKLSCTIRLHQVKHARETGVPPVDKGMLMFYNMGRIQDIKTENSILDLEAAEGYIEELDKYILPLDLALPIFSWGLWYKDGKPWKILNPITREELDSCHLLHKEGFIYNCRSSGIFKDEFIQVNDQIRFEEITPGLSLKAADLVSSCFKTAPSFISIYHWDSSLLQRYGSKNIEMLFDAVH